jgi:hypothetical protein
MIHKVFIATFVPGHLATMSLESLTGMWIGVQTYRTMGLVKAQIKYKEGSLRMLASTIMLTVTPHQLGNTMSQMAK